MFIKMKEQPLYYPKLFLFQNIIQSFIPIFDPNLPPQNLKNYQNTNL